MRMSNHTAEKSLTQLDLRDVDHRVGQRCGGGQLWEPCRPSDIRRWVMALDYPNPIHWDEQFARNTKFGGIIAPQSMAIALDIGHGVQPACVGRIPGSHLIFGGEEWWHYGQPIRPGDQLFQERRFHDYKVTDTKFAGPTMFARGDTIHRNQNGALVAKVRATSIRYLAEEAKKRGLFQNQSAIPKWTPEALRRVEMIRHDWIMSNRAGLSPHFDELKAGDKLPRRAIGPHSIASFTTEYRAFLENVWGSYRWVGVPGMKDPWINQDAGWVKGFTIDDEGAKIDPRYRDGLYKGPSAGHVDGAKGGEIGIPRGYGYGATMGAWATDYLAYWAGHDGMVRHSKMSYRSPSFEGDVTYVDGEVTGKQADSVWGMPLVSINVQMTNQLGTVLVDGAAEVQVPL